MVSQHDLISCPLQLGGPLLPKTQSNTLMEETAMAEESKNLQAVFTDPPGGF